MYFWSGRGDNKSRERGFIKYTASVKPDRFKSFSFRHGWRHRSDHVRLVAGLDLRMHPFPEGEDDNEKDSMDHMKALEDLVGNKIKIYNVWKVNQSEEKEAICANGHLLNSRIYKRRQPNKALISLRLTQDQEGLFKACNEVECKGMII
uniref:Uncharacterized protein n=1 Tax=Solanum tuberosum TaxID=4113 RepID=M1DP50_SOLTU